MRKVSKKKKSSKRELSKLDIDGLDLDSTVSKKKKTKKKKKKKRRIKKGVKILFVVFIVIVIVALTVLIYLRQMKLKNDAEYQENLYYDILDHYNEFVMTNKDADIYKFNNNKFVKVGKVGNKQELTLLKKDITYEDEYLKINTFDDEYYIHYKDLDVIEELSKYDDRYKPSGSTVLKGGVSQIKELPVGMYGMWQVKGTLIESSNMEKFTKRQ